MEDRTLNGISRSISRAIERTSARAGLDVEEHIAVGTMALVEFLGRNLGPMQTVTRLRDVADVIEAEILRGALAA